MRCERCDYAGPFRVCGDGKTEGRLYGHLSTPAGEVIHCDVCCADMDLEWMREHGRITLYLTDDGITNWPGTLKFPVYGSTWTGRHNFAGVVTFAAFRVPGDPFLWSGKCVGHNTQIFHAKRTKERI